MKNCLRTILCVVVLCTVCGISVSADRPLNSYPDGCAEEQRQEYERAIAEANVMHRVDSFYERTKKTLGEFSYRVPEEEYVLLYHLSNVTQEMVNDPEKILERISVSYPNIYIPIYRTNEPEERVVGHVDMYYNASGGFHVASPCFLGNAGKAGSEPGHYLEIAGTFAKAKSICEKAGVADITEAVLVQVGAAENDFVDVVLIAGNADGWFVYDFMNTAHVDGVESAVYTLEEFAELRNAYEEGRRQSAEKQVEKVLSIPRLFVVVTALAIAVIAGGGWLLERHFRRRKTPAETV